MWNRIETVPTDEAVLVAGGNVLFPVVASWSGRPDEPWQIECQAGDILVPVDNLDPSYWMSLEALPPIPESAGL